ncbi:NAD dependent epimerase/dehydratase family protein [Synechococcus sp. A15-62]|uniref:GDP-mannose 4,6-dehydratase n=1 Tax=Synechococcus sp. A15-62 TaxID=1050657 RepID=UPI001645352D|nr:GDP-mannose 4,6-dehydratase [Synechococcus sp. A15-62]QNI99010.1 NAD dependent epimerase/dehydratase family protein [Synechococcus sp. A15-62]
MKALIVGVTGQDGAYLARYLLDIGYKVIGTSRDCQSCDVSRLSLLDIDNNIELTSLAPNDFRSVLKVVSTVMPDEIYNLSGQTSVGLSFDQPVECMESIVSSTLNFLEVIRYLGNNIKYFSAGSSECFGDCGMLAATEETKFKPRSPYGVAKSASFWQVATYRTAYDMYACTGILANHESPLRPKKFVTRKIIDGVIAIKQNRLKSLKLGNLNIFRDWGWAPDYVKAMHLMLQAPIAKDYLIASGHTSSLREFVSHAFDIAGLNEAKYLQVDDSLKRPSDLAYSALSPQLIKTDLGWSSSKTIEEIVKKMYLGNLF